MSTGLSCYMPTGTNERVLPHLNHGQLVCLRRQLFARAVELMQPVFLVEVGPTFDDIVALSNLLAIGISEEETPSSLSQWLAVLKCHVNKMNLFVNQEGFNEEVKEERCR